MKKKIILIGSILAVLLMLSMPVNSAVQYQKQKDSIESMKETINFIGLLRKSLQEFKSKHPVIFNNIVQKVVNKYDDPDECDALFAMYIVGLFLAVGLIGIPIMLYAMNKAWELECDWIIPGRLASSCASCPFSSHNVDILDIITDL
jgi:hypothetical protein